MREIKFRVWDNEQKEFYKPIFEGYKGKIYELLLTQNGEIIRRSIDKNEHQSLFPNRYIIMQYTGLKDKNGKEIYEKDVYNDKIHGLRIIEYNESQACYVSLLLRDKELGNPIHFDNRSEIEIIGNIYENPELLNN